MNKNIKNKDEVVIHQAKNGGIEFKSDFQKETIWASLDQIRQFKCPEGFCETMQVLFTTANKVAKS